MNIPKKLNASHSLPKTRKNSQRPTKAQQALDLFKRTDLRRLTRKQCRARKKAMRKARKEGFALLKSPELLKNPNEPAIFEREDGTVCADLEKLTPQGRQLAWALTVNFTVLGESIND